MEWLPFMTHIAPVISIVDDDLSVRRALRRLVGSAGYTVEACASAREFLASAPRGRIACLVLWTFPAVASVAWNVLAVSVGAMTLYYYMLSHGTAGRVAANFYLIPGTVALLGWALLGESLTY